MFYIAQLCFSLSRQVLVPLHVALLIINTRWLASFREIKLPISASCIGRFLPFHELLSRRGREGIFRGDEWRLLFSDIAAEKSSKLLPLQTDPLEFLLYDAYIIKGLRARRKTLKKTLNDTKCRPRTVSNQRTKISMIPTTS